MTDHALWDEVAEELRYENWFGSDIREVIRAIISGRRGAPAGWHPQEWARDLQHVEDIAAQIRGEREQAGRGHERGGDEGGRSGRGGEGSGGGRQQPQGRRGREGSRGGGGGAGSRGQAGSQGQGGGQQRRDPRGGQMSQEEMIQAWEEAAREQETMWRRRQAQGHYHGGGYGGCPDCGGYH